MFRGLWVPLNWVGCRITGKGPTQDVVGVLYIFCTSSFYSSGTQRSMSDEYDILGSEFSSGYELQ